MRAFMFCSWHKCLYLSTVEKLCDTRRLKFSYFPSSPSSRSTSTLESATKIEKIYSALASAKFLKLKNCKEYLESAYSEDVNFHLQSLRDAPPPPIMYTGIIYLGNPEKKTKKKKKRESVITPPLSPPLFSITHHQRVVYTKGTSPTARPIRELSIMQNFVEAGLIFRRRIYRSAYWSRQVLPREIWRNYITQGGQQDECHSMSATVKKIMSHRRCGACWI